MLEADKPPARLEVVFLLGPTIVAATVFRPPVWQRLVCSLPLLAAAVLLVIGGISDGGWTLLAAALGAVAVLGFLWRAWLLRIDLGQDITVVNLTRTIHIPWSELARFRYDGGVRVQRKDGREHGVTAFTSTSGAIRFGPDPFRQVWVDLEKARKRRRKNQPREIEVRLG